MKRNKLGQIIIALSLLISLNACAHDETQGKKAKTNQTLTTQALNLTVYHSPTCNCCSKWIEHLKENNMHITQIKTENINAVKDKYGVPKSLRSCHTAIIDGYIIEGHVPSKDIKKLLAEKTKIMGLSVPGMPIGTPGMERDNKKEAYSVFSFTKTGGVNVFSHYESE